jgi:hypothetical protein
VLQQKPTPFRASTENPKRRESTERRESIERRKEKRRKREKNVANEKKRKKKKKFIYSDTGWRKIIFLIDTELIESVQ